MGPTADAGHDLGPLQAEYVATGIPRYPFVAGVAGGLVAVALGFVVREYNIELWIFGGFAAVVAGVSAAMLRHHKPGRLAFHRDGFRYAHGGQDESVRWGEVAGARVVRIAVKMEGLVTVEYKYEVAVAVEDGRQVSIGLPFLDQFHKPQVGEIVARFEPFAA